MKDQTSGFGGGGTPTSADARTDAFTFYALGTVSFLETAVPAYVENLCILFQGDQDFTNWLRTEWTKEEGTHGILTRDYVEELWPEFEWQAAYRAYYDTIPKRTTRHLRPSRALEALSRCVTETQAAMIYRCLAAYTRDPRLRALLARLSADEVRHYKYFRSTFSRYQATERNGPFAICRTILGRSELVKTRDLKLAFAPLNGFWRSAMPFASLAYTQFISEAGKVLAKHFPVAAAERMLLKPLMGSGIIKSISRRVLRASILRQYPVLAAAEDMGMRRKPSAESGRVFPESEQAV